MTEKLTNAEIRRLKSAAQRLQPVLKLGKAGLSAEFIIAVDLELQRHELIKLRFDDFKDERKTLAQQLAEKTGSHLVWIVGHVAVFYRRRVPDGAGHEATA